MPNDIAPYRRPPHNLEAEMALLGAILVNNKAYEKVSGFLRPEHFSAEPHARIFEVCGKMIGDGRVADPITLKAHFEQDESLEDIGGPAYLMKLANSAVTVINATEYGRIIHDLWMRREMIAHGEGLVERAYHCDVGIPASSIAAEALTGICSVVDEAGTTNGRLLGVWLHEVEAEANSDDVVGGLLQVGSFSVVYGEPKCGKSFFVTDIALHAALGWTWRKRTVRRVLVVYIAAEGGGGFGRRFQAFQQRHDLDKSPLPFRLIRSAVNLHSANADTELLIAEIKKLAAEVNLPAVLVIIDTLSRVMVGGNENAAEDMGAFVANVDRIREVTGAHCCVVHHKGKDDSRGMRGSTVLRGAIDTAIEVRRDKESGISTSKVVDQRDRESGDEFHFTLEPVILGTDEGDEDITSCVVVPTDVPHSTQKRVTGQTEIALKTLHNIVCDHGETPPPINQIPPTKKVVRLSLWQEHCERRQISTSDKPDSKQKAFKRSAQTLQERGIIGVYDPWVWLADNRT